jgi:hypothetical protein
VNEQQKVGLFERAIDQWNKGDLEQASAEAAPNFEWDVTQSNIPGETRVYRGAEEYLRFARGWREALGPTQIRIEETFISFEGNSWTGAVIFTDLAKARATAGLEP